MGAGKVSANPGSILSQAWRDPINPSPGSHPCRCCCLRCRLLKVTEDQQSLLEAARKSNIKEIKADKISIGAVSSSGEKPPQSWELCFSTVSLLSSSFPAAPTAPPPHFSLKLGGKRNLNMSSTRSKQTSLEKAPQKCFYINPSLHPETARMSPRNGTGCHPETGWDFTQKQRGFHPEMGQDFTQK